MPSNGRRRTITRVVLNPNGSVKERVREERMVYYSNASDTPKLWFESGKKVRTYLKLDSYNSPYYEVTEVPDSELPQARKNRQPPHVGLNRAQMRDLEELYSLYYVSDVWGVNDLRRICDLEKQATDEQLNRLLKKYGASVDTEFN